MIKYNVPMSNFYDTKFFTFWGACRFEVFGIRKKTSAKFLLFFGIISHEQCELLIILIKLFTISERAFA